MGRGTVSTARFLPLSLSLPSSPPLLTSISAQRQWCLGFTVSRMSSCQSSCFFRCGRNTSDFDSQHLRFEVEEGERGEREIGSEGESDTFLCVILSDGLLGIRYFFHSKCVLICDSIDEGDQGIVRSHFLCTILSLHYMFLS